MQQLDFDLVREYVNANIGEFHSRRINSLQSLDIKSLIKKNPYLFKAKNVLTAADLVNGFMDAFLSSSEEEHFGMFLEGLAVFVAQQTSGGYKSELEGVDLEFANRGVHYVVQIKSGPNWGNSSQQNRLQQDLATAVSQVRRENAGMDVQAVLGICYGKTRTSYLRGYLKVVGQNFWYFISENKNLYTEIIEPIGYRAREHNHEYERNKAMAVNTLTQEFSQTFCHQQGVMRGAIDWERLLEETSGNYDLNKHGF